MEAPRETRRSFPDLLGHRNRFCFFSFQIVLFPTPEKAYEACGSFSVLNLYPHSDDGRGGSEAEIAKMYLHVLQEVGENEI
jgi:hypothetical protein